MARTREEIGADSAPTTKPKADRRSRKRLSVYLNEDGTPDWDAVPEEDRARLGHGSAPAAAEAPAEVPVEMVGFLLQTMTRIEAAVVAPKLGISSEEAYQCLTPSAELGKPLVEATARVVNKYAGGFGRWSDEIALAALLVTWQASAFSEMRKAAAAAAPKPEPAPAPPDKHESFQPPAAPKPEPLPDELMI